MNGDVEVEVAGKGEEVEADADAEVEIVEVEVESERMERTKWAEQFLIIRVVNVDFIGKSPSPLVG